MNELIPVTLNDNGEQIVSGRDLHEFLGLGERYNDWLPRMTGYGFIENVDYVGFTVISVKPQGGRPSTDHAMKLDMAKELCMLARSEKGKQARQYFIQVEKDWNSPEKIMARALKYADGKLRLLETNNKQLAAQIESDKPKVIFADAVSVSKTSILVGEMAKILKQNGIDTGQNRFFEWLRANGYLISRKGTDYNMPSQCSMERKLFEIKETSVTHSDGHTTINKTPKITGKGQIYFVGKFKLDAGIVKGGDQE